MSLRNLWRRLLQWLDAANDNPYANIVVRGGTISRTPGTMARVVHKWLERHK